MYVYTCMHTYIHTYAHTHAHTHTQASSPSTAKYSLREKREKKPSQEDTNWREQLKQRNRLMLAGSEDSKSSYQVSSKCEHVKGKKSGGKAAYAYVNFCFYFVFVTSVLITGIRIFLCVNKVFCANLGLCFGLCKERIPGVLVQIFLFFMCKRCLYFKCFEFCV